MNKILPQTIILTLIFTATLIACTKRNPSCADLMGNGIYCLQPTTEIEPFDLEQKVDAYIKDNHETMITKIEVNTENLNFIGLTPFGHKLVQISYNNHEAKSVVSPNSQLDPALLVAMLQLALWPTESVRTGLRKPLRLEESHGQRRILANDKLVLDIYYANTESPRSKLTLSFPSAGLEFKVESLPEVENTQ